MKIRDVLRPESVLVYLEEGTKEEMIRQLVRTLPLDGDQDQVLEAVMERERVMSTGIGRGVALPHAKTDRVRGLMAAVGITRNPVPFDAVDGKPVRIFILIVSDPRTTSPHIRALSHISRILNDQARKEALERATSPEEVIAALDMPEE